MAIRNSNGKYVLNTGRDADSLDRSFGISRERIKELLAKAGGIAQEREARGEDMHSGKVAEIFLNVAETEDERLYLMAHFGYSTAMQESRKRMALLSMLGALGGHVGEEGEEAPYKPDGKAPDGPMFG